jgi:hypothetical protein
MHGMMPPIDPMPGNPNPGPLEPGTPDIPQPETPISPDEPIGFASLF